jgi:mannose-6-phosphate isomerase
MPAPQSVSQKSAAQTRRPGRILRMNAIRFDPLLKRIRWGGTRLGTTLGKRLGPETDYAESWEIADHYEDPSIVNTSYFAGSTLKELLRDSNEAMLGRHAGRDQFPLLIKFLDASDRLSVQVHPDDAQAKRFDPTENGKTEAWVIIDDEPGSRVYAGLKKEVTAEAMRAAIDAGKLEDCLHSFEVSAGDCVFIPAGTVHAIGEGILLAEVQQSSDMTFRLYDWARVGSDGQPRELHIEKAIACTNFEIGPVNCQVPQPIEHGHELVSCQYFSIRRYSGAGHVPIPDDDRFHILMSLAEAATVSVGPEVEQLAFGQTLLLPAEHEAATINLAANSTVLDVFLL